ncbi:MAG: ABC transporter permease [Chloroflexi bacterium]|nr:ABC transporter permease [Chloroflexota bacterium]
MSRFLFYLRYAARNLYRERRWTTFAIFSIAAGVAAVVALRSLGLAIGDSLIDNVRRTLHGDILFSSSGNSPFAALGDREWNTFRAENVLNLQTWVEDQGGTMSAYVEASNFQVTRVDDVSVGRPQFISLFLIDPQTYPADGDMLALDPPRVPLRELFTGGFDIVISRNLAESEGLAIGDSVRVTGTTQEFMVRGIVGTENEANIQNIFASFFGFAYVDVAHAALLQINPLPNRISVALPLGTDIEAALQAMPDPDYRSVRTAPGDIQSYQQIADLLADYIVLLGLGALLIGGVGIINTMLVLVRRRTEEIAALKTFGLKGHQVASIFLAEAFLLGVAGTLVGCTLGVVLSGAVNRYGEAFLQQPLRWRLYPDAIVYGAVLGMATTLIFGLIPVLLTLRVRPAIILRPNETHIPTMGVLQSLLALLFMVVSIGLIVGQIIQNWLIGMIGMAVTLALLGVLVLLMWVVVWLVGKVPTFGSVDLRLALRNLSTRRLRTATTLLALSAGMFALSSIAVVGQGASELIRLQFSQSLGGNVLVFSVGSFIAPDLAQDVLDAQLAALGGVQYNTENALYGGRILLVDGQEVEIVMPSVSRRDQNGDGRPDPSVGLRTRRGPIPLNMLMRETNNPHLTSGTLLEGRDLTPEDRGRQVMVVAQGFGTPQSFAMQQISVYPGAMVTLEVEGRQYEFEVVGVISQLGVNFGAAFIPPGSLGSVEPNFRFNVLQVSDQNLNQTLLDLSTMPFVFSLDITFIDGLLTRLINQLAAIPTVVGLLSLLAAATIMANTVALATLERRRQIGILKAVGLKGNRVLWIMLLENTLIGILGAVMGIGLAALFMLVGTALSAGLALAIPRDARLTVLALALAALVIAWIATILSARVAIKERVLNVLRYE